MSLLAGVESLASTKREKVKNMQGLHILKESEQSVERRSLGALCTGGPTIIDIEIPSNLHKPKSQDRLDTGEDKDEPSLRDIRSLDYQPEAPWLSRTSLSNDSIVGEDIVFPGEEDVAKNSIPWRVINNRSDASFESLASEFNE